MLPRGRVILDPQTESALIRAFGNGCEIEARPLLGIREAEEYRMRPFRSLNTSIAFMLVAMSLSTAAPVSADEADAVKELIGRCGRAGLVKGATCGPCWRRAA